MGMGVGRIGDIGVGVCSAHSSPVGVVTIMSTGANSVLVNGRPATNLTSIGVSSCGHASIVVSVSSTVNVEGQGVHRLGDVGVLPGGAYVLSTASETVTAGG